MPTPAQFTETYTPSIVRKLRNLTHTQYESMRGLSRNNTNKGEKTDIQTELNSIRKLCREAMRNNFSREIKYKYGKNRDAGRLYSDGASLQSVPRFIRGALCGDGMIDVDASNCHPQLLLYMCKLNDIPCHYLMTYIQNRESSLKDLMESEGISRSDAKALFLKSINKETKTTKIGRLNIKSTFFRRYDDDMRTIIDKFIKKNTELYEEIQSKEPDNHGGKLMAWLLNVEEGKMLNDAISTIKDKYIIRTLAFDGLMVDRLNYDGMKIDRTELISILNESTKDKGIHWEVKPHDMSMVDDILNMECDADDNIVIYGSSEMDVVNQLFKIKFDGKYWRRNDIHYLLYEKQWINNRSRIIEIIRKAVHKTQGLVEHVDSKGNITYENITQSLSKSKSIVNTIQEIVPENPSFIQDVEIRSLYKISFENGYIDFRAGRFVEFGSHNASYDTINMIHRDFKYIQPHSDIRKELFKKILHPMFCVEREDTAEFHLMEYFLHTQARAMAGEKEDKIFTMINGERDSCKSVYNDLMKNTFGDYVQSFNISTFELKKNDTEEARQLGGLLKHRHARLLTSQEISDKWLNGVLLKKVSSGGDEITARGLYKDEETFVPEFKIMASGNDHPRVKPVDAMDKCFKIKLNCKFVDKGSREDNDRIPHLKYYYKDRYIKEKYIKDSDVLNAMASILIDYYPRTDTFQPKETIEEDDVNLDPRDVIKDRFEMTGDKNDKMYNNEIDEVIYPKLKDYFDSKLHLKRMILNGGAMKFKSNGRRGLCGFKFINPDVENLLDDDAESCEDI